MKMLRRLQYAMIGYISDRTGSYSDPLAKARDGRRESTFSFVFFNHRFRSPSGGASRAAKRSSTRSAAIWSPPWSWMTRSDRGGGREMGRVNKRTHDDT